MLIPVPIFSENPIFSKYPDILKISGYFQIGPISAPISIFLQTMTKLANSSGTYGRSIGRCFWREWHRSKGLAARFRSTRLLSKTATCWWLKQSDFGRVSFGANNWRPKCADYRPHENIRICENIRLKITGISIYDSRQWASAVNAARTRRKWWIQTRIWSVLKEMPDWFWILMEVPYSIRRQSG